MGIESLYFTVSLFSGGVVALLCGFFVFLNDKKSKQNLYWLLLNMVSAVWSFGYMSMLTASDHKAALISNWILHGGAILIPLFYFLFILYLTGYYNKYKWLLFVFLPAAGFFLAINPTRFFIRDVVQKYIFNFVCDAGSLYLYFAIYFFCFVLISLFILIQKILNMRRENIRREEAKKLRFVLFSSLAGFMGGGSVFFITFNIPILPYPIILFAIYPILISYAILKYRLFSVKVVSTELLTTFIWIALAFRTLFSSNFIDTIINGSVLIIAVIIGVFIIKSVYREVAQRERIEKLAVELEEANERQEGLIHFVSHEIKGYLTKSEAAFEGIASGDYGQISDDVRRLASGALIEDRKGVKAVTDILQASNLKNGKVSFEMKPFGLKDLVVRIFDSFKSEAERKGLRYGLYLDHSDPFTMSGDGEKMGEHVLSNLIRNAILYTPAGEVNVYLKRNGNRALIEVKDSGVGITADDMKRLFTEGGHGKESIKVNAHSTGYGLYIAKNIVEAHHGRIWAESRGQGNGSSFFVELNLGYVPTSNEFSGRGTLVGNKA